MKVYILGYDALDINLVERFDFKHLKQKEYGKTDISEYERIATPILWGSFITGENLESEYLKSKPRQGLKNILRPLYKKARDHLPFLTVGVKKWMREIGLMDKLFIGELEQQNVKEDLDRDTIFNLTGDHIAINIPSYNKNLREGNIVMEQTIRGEKPEEDYWEERWDVFKETRKLLLENLDKELVMAWFKIADAIGHLWRSDMKRMQYTYRQLDQLAKTIRKRYDGLVLIVADHGMETLGRYGDHANLDYGYYSSNMELGLDKPKITDFYSVIEEALDWG